MNSLSKNNPNQRSLTENASASAALHLTFWLTLSALAVLYLQSAEWLISIWTINADYSHGFLVPAFAIYYLWTKRHTLDLRSPTTSDDGLVIGVMLSASAIGLLLLGAFIRARSVEAFSMIPFLLGVTSTIYGRRGLAWILPAALYLFFMIPLPRPLHGLIGGGLQDLSTIASSYGLQMLGIPCFVQGNSIQLASFQIGIAETCSGLRMLNAFFALTVAACLSFDRTRAEKCLIFTSAVPIAIASNCIRIILTGSICELVSPEIAGYIFHEVAGWMMVPLGFVLLSIELILLDRLFVPNDPPRQVSALYNQPRR